MDFKIGKHYTWSTYSLINLSSLGREYEGRLIEIGEYDNGVKFGVFITRKHGRWQVPLNINTLKEKKLIDFFKKK